MKHRILTLTVLFISLLAPGLVSFNNFIPPGANSSLQPTIRSFTPASGSVGTTVIITGTNFNKNKDSNIVYFGAVRAVVTAATPKLLTVKVPAGASYQPISVLDKTTGLAAYSSRPFLVTFPNNGHGFLPNSFASKVELTGTDDELTVICDVDGDGKPDLIALHENSDTLSILRNTCTPGVISFAEKTQYKTVSPYKSIATDLDGDGKPDIVVISYSGTISIFKNLSIPGKISLAKRINFKTDDYSYDVCAADIDGDGKPDLALLEEGENVLYKNTSTAGTMSFEKEVKPLTGAGRIVLSDLDGDGKPDIVRAVYGDGWGGPGAVYIYKNTSAADTVSFEYISSTPSGYSYSLSVGDLDGDEKPDVAVTDGYLDDDHFVEEHPVYVLKNTTSDSTISFENKAIYFTTAPPGRVVINDLDGDGKPELTVSNGKVFSILRNNCSADAIDFSAPLYYEDTTGNERLNIGDLDGDGKPEIVGSNFVVRNQANYPYLTSFTPGAAATPATIITISGFNLTGCTAVRFGGKPALSFTVRSDTIIRARVARGASGNVEVTTREGTDSLAGFSYTKAPSIFSFDPPFGEKGDSISLLGINFNGTTAVSFGGKTALSFTVTSDTSITAVVGSGATGDISVTSPAGTGTLEGFIFSGHPVITYISPGSGAVGTTVTIKGRNFNKTAEKNIVYFGAARATVTDASATSLSVVVPPGTTCQPISVVNKATGLTGYSDRQFIITFPPGTDSFTQRSFAEKTRIADLAWGGISFFDMNGDGMTDIIKDTYDAYDSYILMNRSLPGTVLFDSVEISYSGSISKPPADLNGDGNLDLVVVADWPPGKLSFLRNTGRKDSISFIPGMYYPVEHALRHVEIGDLDGDGRPDLAIAVYDEYGDYEIHYPAISVLRNISTKDSIFFDSKIDLTNTIIADQLAVNDIDGDGKADLVVHGHLNGVVSILKNVSTPGRIAFETPVNIGGSRSFVIGDLDGDSKPDIIIQDSIFRNTSTPGNIAFEDRIYFPASNDNYNNISLSSSLDGDEKPDLIVENIDQEKTISVFKNTSNPGLISFDKAVKYETGDGESFPGPDQIASFDIDGDGKPDIVGQTSSQELYILRNQMGYSPLFSVSSKVSYMGDTVLFKNQSFNASSWQWDFDGDGNFDSKKKNPSHSYATPGVYNVKLRINNDPSLEKVIPITILPNRGTPYERSDGGNFEKNPNDFAGDHIGYNIFSRGSSIYKGKDSTHSGSNAWVTNINSPYCEKQSTAYLYTPSFNCTAPGDYTISFFAKYDIWNYGDYFKIEYSTDKGNTWQPLGTSVQTNWYDYINRTGEACFGLNDAKKYKIKTYTTNVFAGYTSVAFRVVYITSLYGGGIGIALDDFTLTGPSNDALSTELLPLSTLKSININERQEKILLYGNLTSSYINVITPSSMLKKPLDAEILNVQGSAIKRINITDPSTTIYVDKLTAGKYFIRFIQDGKVLQTEQFVKQ